MGKGMDFNPTIYRAGLAFQSLIPRSAHRVTGVVLAGAVATIAGVFPNLSAQLLGFVGTYGMILGPIGAIIWFVTAALWMRGE